MERGFLSSVGDRFAERTASPSLSDATLSASRGRAETMFRRELRARRAALGSSGKRVGWVIAEIIDQAYWFSKY